MNTKAWRVLHKLTTPVLLVGYGGIGRGLLPLLERHFAFGRDQLAVLDPNNARFDALAARGVRRLLHTPLTRDNHVAVLDSVFGKSAGGDGADGSVRGVIMNASVDTSTVDLIRYAQANRLLYVDTVIEPWAGAYFDAGRSTSERSNYALREELLGVKRAAAPGAATALTCIGANPGMVSWMVKAALLQLRADLGGAAAAGAAAPVTRDEWARLMQQLGVKGVHVAERDTQFVGGGRQRAPHEFWNTWSCEGFLSEAWQPAELAWGTHERWMPPTARRHTFGCGAAIYLEQPGCDTRVRTWCPTLGAQHGLLVTHNEAISIGDFFTVRRGDGTAEYRPTVHYAYHPCNDAVLSVRDMIGAGNVRQRDLVVLSEQDIAGGVDELGVLLYGHARNALWYGSTLSHAEAVAVAPEQNATSLQVTSAMVAGLDWALRNPRRGVLEADEIDHVKCLEVQAPYLGRVHHAYTDWNPLHALLPGPGNCSLFAPPERTDRSDPWQFANVLV